MRVSVIVVSQGRAEALTRCITALQQLDDVVFELVVVCDLTTAAVLRQLPGADAIKIDICDTPNIATLRNRGITLAGGDVLAFIDDDAVAEPTWLLRLTEPFSDPEVTATSGFVRGRNGVSFQWQASSTDRFGRRFDRIANAELPDGEVWRTEGCNMAFRATALRQIRGFDEAFAFYLDETDVNLRLPGKTRIVADAEVHHSFAASARRRPDRVPTTLYEIGASSAYFMRKHAKVAGSAILDDFLSSERRRAIRHMIAGRIEPRDVRRLLDSWEAGVRKGQAREIQSRVELLRTPTTFVPFRLRSDGPKLVLSGPWRSRNRLKSDAKNALDKGYRLTVVLFAPDLRPLQVRFEMPGYWLHIGGQFGRGLRSEPRVQWATRSERTTREVERAATIRGVPCETCALHKPC